MRLGLAGVESEHMERKKKSVGGLGGGNTGLLLSREEGDSP